MPEILVFVFTRIRIRIHQSPTIVKFQNRQVGSDNFIDRGKRIRFRVQKLNGNRLKKVCTDLCSCAQNSIDLEKTQANVLACNCHTIWLRTIPLKNTWGWGGGGGGGGGGGVGTPAISAPPPTMIFFHVTPPPPPHQ